jgi:hypothetical protein
MSVELLFCILMGSVESVVTYSYCCSFVFLSLPIYVVRQRKEFRYAFTIVSVAAALDATTKALYEFFGAMSFNDYMQRGLFSDSLSLLACH